MKNAYREWNDIPEDARILLISNLTTELSTLRAKAKITQEELAARMGVATETVSRICRDIYEPPINMAIAVCVALELFP